MTKIRRHFQPGQTIFLTHITYRRQPILVENVGLLDQAMKFAQAKSGLEVIAWVALPDHLHLLVNCEREYVSDAMLSMKMSFGQRYRAMNGMKRGRVWQHRFWDRIIWDYLNFERHLHYIHFNPVHHDLVAKPGDYPHSSFRWFVENGFYDLDWAPNFKSNDAEQFGE